MDGQRFDSWTRSLNANRTRRHALKGAVALALGGVVGGHAAPAAAAVLKATVRCRHDEATKTTFNTSGRHAQTFKAPVTGTLSEVTVRISHRWESTGDYVAQIVATDESGAPTAKVLAQKAVPCDQLLGGEQPVRFAFGGGAATVRKGRRYAVVIGHPGGVLDLVHRHTPGGDPCPGSVLFTNFSATGGTFHQNDGTDMVFTAVIKYR